MTRKDLLLISFLLCGVSDHRLQPNSLYYHTTKTQTLPWELKIGHKVILFSLYHTVPLSRLVCQRALLLSSVFLVLSCAHFTFTSIVEGLAQQSSHSTISVWLTDVLVLKVLLSFWTLLWWIRGNICSWIMKMLWFVSLSLKRKPSLSHWISGCGINTPNLLWSALRLLAPRKSWLVLWHGSCCEVKIVQLCWIWLDRTPRNLYAPSRKRHFPYSLATKTVHAGKKP